jgi:hypothetical protein
MWICESIPLNYSSISGPTLFLQRLGFLKAKKKFSDFGPSGAGSVSQGMGPVPDPDFPSSSKNIKRNLDFYCLVTSF